MARTAGALYLVIICAGVWGEGIARAGMAIPGDDAGTAAAIRGADGLFRAAMGADLLMALCDASVAVLLFLMLRPLAPAAALTALVFRLIQTAVIAANMVVTAAALNFAGAGLPGALPAMELRALGYDIGLAFFGICNLALAAILTDRSGLGRSRATRAMGLALGASGLVYLAGSTLHLVAPQLLTLFQPAYILPLAAETAFALWLLLAGGQAIASARPAAH